MHLQKWLCNNKILKINASFFNLIFLSTQITQIEQICADKEISVNLLNLCHLCANFQFSIQITPNWYFQKIPVPAPAAVCHRGCVWEQVFV